MKALILLGTLKKSGLSNTETLSEFFRDKLISCSVECEIIKLVNYNILPGSYNNMGDGDDWPLILEKILSSEVIILSTPIWWGNHSSEIQKVIERLDNLHDYILEGNKSGLEHKVGGILITGDSDGAQHIIGNVANFFNAVGVILPPFASLAVLSENQKKGAITPKPELLKMYKEQYDSTAKKMISQILAYQKS